MLKIWKNSNELSKERIINSIKAIHDIKGGQNNNNKSLIKETMINNDIKEELEYLGKHLIEMKEFF